MFAVEKCIFEEILSKFWLFKNNCGSLGSISRLLVGRLKSECNHESYY